MTPELLVGVGEVLPVAVAPGAEPLAEELPEVVVTVVAWLFPLLEQRASKALLIPEARVGAADMK